MHPSVILTYPFALLFAAFVLTLAPAWGGYHDSPRVYFPGLLYGIAAVLCLLVMLFMLFK